MKLCFKCAVIASLLLLPTGVSASGHHEAPIVALDRVADITDVFASRSYGDGANATVTLILCVDSLIEPASGPIWFPFDPKLRYEIRVDNNNDAVADIQFVFRFQNERLQPKQFQYYLGAGSGVLAPSNSPPPVSPGTQVVPQRIGAMDGDGVGLRQTYTVTMIKNGIVTPLKSGDGAPFYALPGNVGPRTMNAAGLRNSVVYSLPSGFKLFAGTADDPFAADSAALSDTFNFRSPVQAGILSAVQDVSNFNHVSDSYSAFAVNAIALQVPIATLTRTGSIEPATSPAPTIGVWGVTSRRLETVRKPAHAPTTSGPFIQVQHMGNPLINSRLTRLADKNLFNTRPPRRDEQFAATFTDPFVARVMNALTGGAIAIKAPPRVDLLPLFTYGPPIAAPGTPTGPIADLLRLNTGIAPTDPTNVRASRLGLLGGDPAGFPNGRRLFDDVTDIMLRLIVGGVLDPSFPGFSTAVGGRLGDGVNVNDVPFAGTFPYLASAPSGRDRRHIDPAEPGCPGAPGAVCP